MKDLKGCEWRQNWVELTRGFAFQYNPALQPRAIIVYGCINKQVSDSEIKQLLRILVKVCGGGRGSHSTFFSRNLSVVIAAVATYI